MLYVFAEVALVKHVLLNKQYYYYYYYYNCCCCCYAQYWVISERMVTID